MTAEEGADQPTEYWFEELDVGRTVESTVRVTPDRADRFAELTDDIYPVRTESYGERSSRFDGRVVHETLLFALVEAAAEALTGAMNPRGFAYGYDHVRVTAPVQVGTALTVTAEVTETSVYDEEYGRVTYETEATDGDGRTVLVYEGTTLVERRREDDD